MEIVGPERNVAWHILGATLRTLRDRLPLELAAHLGAQLPLLVRGTYYEQFRPGCVAAKLHTEEEFLACVAADFGGLRPVHVRAALRAMLAVIDRHVAPQQADKAVVARAPAPDVAGSGRSGVSNLS